MKRYITTFLALLTMAVSLLLLAQFELPVLAEAASGSAGSPVIRRVDISDDETQMFIYGENFCRNPVAKLSIIKLDIDSVQLRDPELIVADLPDNLDPAGHRLSVECGVDSRGNRLLGYVFIGSGGAVLGDAGPPGPRGSRGADGADWADGADRPTGVTGATGPTGLTGATGPAGPTGAQGPAGANGAKGDPGVSNWERLESGVITVADGTIGTATQDCTVGKKLLGGGCTSDNATGVAVWRRARPLDDDTWECTLLNVAGTSIDIRAHAICGTVQ